MARLNARLNQAHRFQDELGVRWVLPLGANKKSPSVKWLNQADLDRIPPVKDWAPGSNWGVICGPSGVTVVDVDMHEPGDGLKDWQEILEKAGRKLPDTLTVKTAGGGYHFWFRNKNGTVLPKGKLTPNIDWQSANAIIVWPGLAD
jgi:hypothetical protein